MTLWKRILPILIFIFFFHIIYLLYCKWFNPPITITQISNLITCHEYKIKYINFYDVSPNGRLAVIASEDQLFPEHNGFDWNSIHHAMAWNKNHPARIHGASTISQQTAKNIFLWQGGGWFRKGMEVYFTFMIELLYSKERILELYLNVTEMGPSLFGIECASETFFNHSAKNLTTAEAAMIAASLPNPHVYTVKPMSKFVQKRYPGIVNQMQRIRNRPDVSALLSKKPSSLKNIKY